MSSETDTPAPHGVPPGRFHREPSNAQKRSLAMMKMIRTAAPPLLMTAMLALIVGFATLSVSGAAV